MTSSEAVDGAVRAPVSKARGSPGTEGIPTEACERFCLAQEHSESSGGMATATMRAGDSSAGAVPPMDPRRPRSRAALWLSLSTSASLLGTAGTAGYLHSRVGLALAAVEVTVLLIAALTILIVLLVVILHGNDDTCERLFRFLRWAANRPEPPAPSETRPPRGT